MKNKGKNKKKLKVNLEKILPKKYSLKIIPARCPFCKRTAERIGIYIENGALIAYTGLACPLCGKKRKAGKIDLVQFPLFSGKIKY